MQIEITLTRAPDASYCARDLGYLLHKHPDHVHEREIAVGKASIFFPEANSARCTAALFLDVDPIALVRGRNVQADGLLDRYVNDRPFVANSFLSVALTRSFAQTMAGKSKERQQLAEISLPLQVRVVPVAVSGGADMIKALFEPLGYAVDTTVIDDSGQREIHDFRLLRTIRLADVLNHLYVLVPVLDDAKHWWVGDDEVDVLLNKGQGWLAAHPHREMIARRALKHRRGLVRLALARLDAYDDDHESNPSNAINSEQELEKPIRLHELRHERVVELLRDAQVASVLDLGCGGGQLLRRLVKEKGLKRIVGIDPSIRSLEIAARRMHLDTAGESTLQRIQLQMGSLTYGDRRWRGFDAATVIEVIEHIDPSRLAAMELSVFGDAMPMLVIVTTPNREYNVLFERMAENELRHPDHRFEWTRAEFEAWALRIATSYGYAVRCEPLGPQDARYGAPSQIAIFSRSPSSTLEDVGEMTSVVGSPEVPA